MSKNLRPALLALLLTGALAGCGSSSSTTPKSKPPSASGSGPSSSGQSAGKALSGHVKVAITNYKFAPASLTVKAGTKVTFTNNDQTAHTATADSGGFDTGTINTGKSATITLTKSGVNPYHCSFHAFMTGKIAVQG